MGILGALPLSLYVILRIARMTLSIIAYFVIAVALITVAGRYALHSIRSSCSAYAYYDEASNEVVFPNSERS